MNSRDNPKVTNCKIAIATAALVNPRSVTPNWKLLFTIPKMTENNSDYNSELENVLGDKEHKFWEEKKNRKLYFDLKDLQKKLIKSETKVRLLKRCMKLRLVPETLKVRIDYPGNHSSQEAELRWQGAQVAGGLNLTKEALIKAQHEATKLRTELRRAKADTEDRIGDIFTWVQVEEKLEKDFHIAAKISQNGTRQRLRNLLTKEKRDTPSWLRRSGASVLETTAMEEDSQMQFSQSLTHTTPGRMPQGQFGLGRTSTPLQPSSIDRRRLESEEVAHAIQSHHPPLQGDPRPGKQQKVY